MILFSSHALPSFIVLFSHQAQVQGVMWRRWASRLSVVPLNFALASTSTLCEPSVISDKIFMTLTIPCYICRVVFLILHLTCIFCPLTLLFVFLHSLYYLSFPSFFLYIIPSYILHHPCHAISTSSFFVFFTLPTSPCPLYFNPCLIFHHPCSFTIHLHSTSSC